MWPEYNEKLIKRNEFKLIIQVNGKVRGSLELPTKISNNEIVGDKKKYLQALFNLNNKLVEKYNAKGGDATGYYLEFEDDKPYSVAISGLI